MPSDRDVQRAETAATGVGVLTLALGAALIAAPAAVGRAAGVTDADTGLRVVGVVDAVIGAGLLAGRPRWPWLVARAAANPPTGAYLGALGRRQGSTRLVVIAALIAAVTAADAQACRALHSAGR